MYIAAPPLIGCRCIGTTAIRNIQRYYLPVNAGDTSAQSVIRRLLFFTKKNVAVIKTPVDLENWQDTQSAFPTTAIRDHRDTAAFQRIEQRFIGSHVDR